MALKLYSISDGVRHSVINDNNEKLGIIEKFFMDMETGRVIFAILSYGKSFSRKKFFAVPWELLDFSIQDTCFVLNVPEALIREKTGCPTANQVFESIDTSAVIYECTIEDRWDEKGQKTVMST
jgi:hypothetical protein